MAVADHLRDRNHGTRGGGGSADSLLVQDRPGKTRVSNVVVYVMDAQTLIDGLCVAASFGMDNPFEEALSVSKLKHDPNARVIDRFGGLDLIKVGRTIFIEDQRGLAYFVKWEDCNDFV